MQKKFEVNDYGEFSKTISESDVYLFAGICGDFNPVHVNQKEAEKSRFKNRVVHGALISAFISTVLGTVMPGPGTIYLEQNIKFIKPVFIGQTITAKAIIRDIISNKACMETTVINQDGIVVAEGTAKVLLP